jgi:hypothetical protein
MARCSGCNRTIISGGVYDADARFCSKACLFKARLRQTARQIPPELLEQELLRAHRGPCPKCRGGGPVDVHDAHQIWSAVVLTRFWTTSEVSCRRCARSRQGASLATCAVLGWWGIPFGLVMTPVQIIRNIAAMSGGPNPRVPSDRLREAVRMHIAQYALSQGLDPGALTSESPPAAPPTAPPVAGAPAMPRPASANPAPAQPGPSVATAQRERSRMYEGTDGRKLL